MAAKVTDNKSYFDGGTLGLIGMCILTGLLCLITLGIGAPWAICMMESWEAKHTVINGRRLKFTGKGIQLLGRYLLWVFLTIITFGIYSWWLAVNIEKWRVKHLVYADGKSEFDSRFTAGAGGWFVMTVSNFFIILFTFGLGIYWASKRFLKWKLEHTEIGGSALVFNGTAGQLFVKYLLLAIFTPITLGIYALFFPVILLKWEKSNTEALYKTAEIKELSTAHEKIANVDFAKFKIAANDLELSLVKLGIKGTETQEELEEFASHGSAYCQYKLADLLKGVNPLYEGRALELLKSAADGKYHKAMYDYALHIKSDKVLYAQYLEGAAKQGNTDAPWLLKEYYEQLANETYKKDRKQAIELLDKAAYWFKVAIEQENGYALNVKDAYPDMVERLAIWYAREYQPKKKSNVGAIIGIIFGIIFLIGIIGAVISLIVGSGFKPSFTQNKLNDAYKFEDYYYNIVDSSAEICGYDGEGGNVVIPAFIDGYSTIIGENAFRDIDEIFTVIISEGITRIGEYAFADCPNLTYVYLPKSVSYVAENALNNTISLDTVYYAGTDSEWNEISGIDGTVSSIVTYNTAAPESNIGTNVGGNILEDTTWTGNIPSSLVGDWTTAWREGDVIYLSHLTINDNGTLSLTGGEYIYGFMGVMKWEVAPMGNPMEYANYTYTGSTTSGELSMTFTHSDVGEAFTPPMTMSISNVTSDSFFSTTTYFRGTHQFAKITELCGVDLSA